MKRILPLLLCVLLLIPVIALPVFAAETENSSAPCAVYNFAFKPDSQVAYCDSDVPSGVYLFHLLEAGQVVMSCNLNVSFDYFIYDGIGAFSYPSNPEILGDENLGFGFVKNSMLTGLGKTALFIAITEDEFLQYSPDSPRPVLYSDEDLSIELEYVGPLPSPGRIKFVQSIQNTLKTCIDWVGTVTTSLLSGELNGLLLLAAIPIAITVVMLSIKFIRRNSWGC